MEKRDIGVQSYAKWLLFSKLTQTGIDFIYEPHADVPMRNLTPRAWTSAKGVIREGQATQYRIKMISRQTQTPTKGQIKTTNQQGGRILFGRADRWDSPYRPDIATTRIYQDVVVPASGDSEGTSSSSSVQTKVATPPPLCTNVATISPSGATKRTTHSPIMVRIPLESLRPPKQPTIRSIITLPADYRFEIPVFRDPTDPLKLKQPDPDDQQ
ncbi:hypothetical protein KPH14_000806 [Odynerus spinipes]|uniref:Uncharacterized protein n=1 Tax=Odynerus spinipes TaxID=1348599 RepID=A0AAD9RDS6_9HYME|nr:hypothetical protein KPH14_000806 [Odynerus spinipes]